MAEKAGMSGDPAIAGNVRETADGCKTPAKAEKLHAGLSEDPSESKRRDRKGGPGIWPACLPGRSLLSAATQAALRKDPC